jgi:ribosome biogenesis GTPase A
MLAQLRRGKPCIKLLNKSDLSDPARLAPWIASLESQNQVKTLVCSINDDAIGGLPALCRSLVPRRDNRSTMIYAMIAGIPNVGKSTLINRLAERKIAKTGNEAALTRMQQRIEMWLPPSGHRRDPGYCARAAGRGQLYRRIHAQNLPRAHHSAL